MHNQTAQLPCASPCPSHTSFCLVYAWTVLLLLRFVYHASFWQSAALVLQSICVLVLCVA